MRRPVFSLLPHRLPPLWLAPVLALPAPISRALRPSIHNPSVLQRTHPRQTYTSRARAPAPPPDPDEPTIFALSTPPGTSAIAIIRISGPACTTIYTRLTRSPRPPRPRHASVAPLHHPTTHAVLDPGALTLFFPGPHSHTGTDVLELHVHGSRAVLRAVLSAIPLCAGNTRSAEPGEFSRRAFLNARTTLPELEALGALLAAQTESQRALAVASARAGGAADGRYERWRRQLVEARGELEALIDFSEDQGFASPLASVAAGVRALAARLRGHVRNAARGEMVRAGISLALVGAPNAGKSSLLNAVVGREAAIVSPEPGTTRDVVETAVDVGGFMVLLGDTAGLRREGAGAVEREGIRRARERARGARVVVAVVDGTAAGVEADVAAVVDEAKAARKHVLLAVNKTDLMTPAAVSQRCGDMAARFPGVPVHAVSCLADAAAGVQPLLAALVGVFQDLTAATGEGAEEAAEGLGATERVRALVEECLRHLEEFLEMEAVGEEAMDVVVAAEVLRSAAGCLGRVTGRGDVQDVEEVLGVVFERFCVGK
ncbi:small GTP-binding protein [Geopyxis carbonaria]|nr:small GTP-binding protein [Geopyxis carbonaria]